MIYPNPTAPAVRCGRASWAITARPVHLTSGSNLNMPSDAISQNPDWPLTCLHFAPQDNRHCDCRGGWRAPRDCGRCGCYEPDPVEPHTEAGRNRADLWARMHG